MISMQEPYLLIFNSLWRCEKYLHTDRLGSGSGSAVTDGRGEAVHVLGYMPYGETLLDLSQGYETPYQFTGYEKDQTFSFAISNWDGEGEGGLTIKRPDGVIEMQIPTEGTSPFYGNIKNINDITINWVRGIYSGKGSGRNYLYKERYIRNEDYERRILPKLKNK